MRNTCAVCKRDIEPDQSFIHHPRLNVDVHMTCPMTNVCGEDITTHTVLFKWAR